MDRLIFAAKVDAASQEETEGLLRECEDAVEREVPELIFAITWSLPKIAGNLAPSQHPRLHLLIVRLLLRKESSRVERKCALAALEAAPLSFHTHDILHVLEALEEPQEFPSQMHIVMPSLARFSLLVAVAVENPARLTFCWLRIIIHRCLSHTNGWIRLWGVENLIGIPHELLKPNFEVVLGMLLPSLTASDLLWRLLDKGELDSFYQRIEDFLSSCSSQQGYYSLILNKLLTITCPMSQFLLISILPSLPATEAFGENHIQTLWHCLRCVNSMSHLPLRITSAVKLLTFFLKSCIIKDSMKLLGLLGPVCRRLSGAKKGEVARQLAESIKFYTVLDVLFYNDYSLLVDKQLTETSDDEFQDVILLDVIANFPSGTMQKVSQELNISSPFLNLKRPRDKVYEKMCLCQIAMWSEKFSDPTSPRSPANLHAVVEHALQELDMAVTFEYKDKLLQIFIKLAPEVEEEDLLRRGLSAAGVVMREEKKSSKYLPAVQTLVSLSDVLLSKNVLVEEVVEVYDSLLATSSLNVCVALVLSRCLASSKIFSQSTSNECQQCVSLIHSCAKLLPILVELAVFGPIPKKEVLVLNEVFSRITAPEELRMHECVWRTRLYSISALLRISEKDESLASEAVLHILKVVEECDKSASRSFGLSMAHRRKTRAVSLLLLLFEHLKLQSCFAELFEKGVSWLLDPCQQYSVRLPTECLLSRIALCSQQHMQLILTMDKTILRERILRAILPWMTAQNFGVRCSAIAAARLILRTLPPSETHSLANSLALFDSEPAGNAQRVVENLCKDFFFSSLKIESDLTTRNVLAFLPAHTGLPEDEILPCIVPEQCADPIALLLGPPSQRRLQTSPSLVFGNLEKSTRSAPAALEEGPKTEYSIPTLFSSNSTQKKVIPDTEACHQDNLIVIASLIEKAANLGGLCRTSEIFRVKELVVSDASVVADHNFQALSMSAENWQKITEVKESDLSSFLAEKAASGYEIVAAEQASDSLPLHSFSFPNKCVLVMGDERKGVPVSLLRSAHSIVHIEQLGRVRSLNVHVAAALFIAKYAEQHLMNN